MPRLIVSPGRWDERIYDLQTGSHGIGRGREVAIQVGNKSLSRVHAELVVDDRCNVVLRDLGSKNGTFVDGARITMPTQLFDGQRFVCGDVGFVFVDSETTAPPPESIVQEISAEASRVLVEEMLAASRKRRHPNAHRVGPVLPRGAENRLKVLLEVSRLLSSSGSIDNLLAKILDLVFSILDIDRAALIMIDPETGEFGPPVVETARDISLGEPYSRNILNYVRERSVAALFSDAVSDPRLEDAQSIVIQSVRSSMCAPLKPRDKVIGVLYVDNLNAPALFTGDDLELLSAFAAQAAIAIDNARLAERLQQEAVARNNLLRFFPPTTIAQLMAQPKFADEPIETVVTALFCDISGFTEMSARMSPRDIVALLNHYFPKITEVVFRHEGTLEKYIGDALLAVWGAPFRRDDDALRASMAAVEMQQVVNDLSIHSGMPAVRIHIGLHSGPVAAGNIGSEHFLQYATIGDTTNLASRICGLAEAGEIAMSEDTARQLTPHLGVQLSARLVGPHRSFVKGRERPLNVYKLEYG